MTERDLPLKPEIGYEALSDSEKVFFWEWIERMDLTMQQARFIMKSFTKLPSGRHGFVFGYQKMYHITEEGVMLSRDD